MDNQHSGHERLPGGATDVLMDCVAEAMAPLVADLLSRLPLTLDDCDDPAWAEFASAYVGMLLGRPEAKRRLAAVLEQTGRDKRRRRRGGR